MSGRPRTGRPARWVRSAVLLSDLHLRGPAGANQRAFCQFVRTRAVGHTLVVAGDLFDWYLGGRPCAPQLAPVLDAMREHGDAVWLQGNHDVALRRTRLDGIVVSPGPIDLSWAGRRVAVRHGDRIPPIEPGHGALLELLEGPWAQLGSRLLGPRRAQRLGEFLAAGSRALQGGEQGYDGRDPRWLAHARTWASHEGADLAVVGHGHWLGWWDGLVCLGDWVHWGSYLELGADGQARLRLHRAVPGEDPVLARGPVGALPRLQQSPFAAPAQSA